MKINRSIFFSIGAIGVAGIAAFFYTRKSGPEMMPGEASVSLTDSSVTAFNNIDLNLPADFFQSISSGVGSMFSSQSIGIKNNNPTNMKWNSLINWQGQLGKDSRGFIVFDTPENGIRAATKNLKSYAKSGLVTVEQIIKRWTDGDSAAIQASYIKNVSNALGISSNQAVAASQYPVMIAAMIKQENGSQPYAMSTILAGVNAA